MKDEVTSLADDILEIPVYQLPHSLNVASAASIAIYEVKITSEVILHLMAYLRVLPSIVSNTVLRKQGLPLLRRKQILENQIEVIVN